MAQIFPFRALRFDPVRVPHRLALTQPYDKITPAMQERYYQQSPYNLVRIELGKAEPADDSSHNAYTRAAATLAAWRRDGILSPDPQPSIYLCVQTFSSPGSAQQTERRGFIALSPLHDYSDRVVFRHEQTLSKPKADRLDLLRATRLQTGQLFMLYTDPAGHVERLLHPTGDPATDVQDEYGVRHRLWPIAATETIAALQRLMQDKQLIIADGHHRYETALAYRDERCSAGHNDPAAERLMLTFVNMDSPGLVILPTHRVLRDFAGFRAQQFLAVVKKFFDLEPLPSPDLSNVLARLRQAGSDSPAFVAVTDQGMHLLRARPGAADSSLSDLSPAQRTLDVVQLHRVVLQHVLGISEQAVREFQPIDYLRDAAEAVERVRSGATAAFLMNPVTPQQLRDVAFAGQVMPQKSTDFYPKLLSGMAMYALD